MKLEHLKFLLVAFVVAVFVDSIGAFMNFEISFLMASSSLIILAATFISCYAFYTNGNKNFALGAFLIPVIIIYSFVLDLFFDRFVGNEIWFRIPAALIGTAILFWCFKFKNEIRELKEKGSWSF